MHLTIVVFVVLGVAFIGCGGPDPAQDQIDHPERHHGEGEAMFVLTKHQLEHIEFAVDTASERTVSIPLSLQGRVALDEKATAHIAARVAGRIEKVHKVINDRARRGEVFMKLV